MAMADISHRFFFIDQSVTVTCIAEPCGLRYRVFHSVTGGTFMQEVVGFNCHGDLCDGPPCIWRLLLIYPRLCQGDFSEMKNFQGVFWGRSPIVSPSCWKVFGGGTVDLPVGCSPGSKLPYVCPDFDWLAYYRKMRVVYLSQGDHPGLAMMQEALCRHNLLAEIPAWEPTGIYHIDSVMSSGNLDL